jgi:hypothetical protein
MDHIPGPIIATVAPRTATMIGVSEWLAHTAKNIQTPRIAITVPATGVQRPKNTNTAATEATKKGSLVARPAGSRKCTTA